MEKSASTQVPSVTICSALQSHGYTPQRPIRIVPRQFPPEQTRFWPASAAAGRRRKPRSPTQTLEAKAQRVLEWAVFSLVCCEASILLRIHDPTTPEWTVSKYLNGAHQKFRLAKRPQTGYTSLTEPLSTLRSVLPDEWNASPIGVREDTAHELPRTGNPRARVSQLRQPAQSTRNGEQSLENHRI